MCIINWGNFVLQIGAALFYYKLGQKFTNWGKMYYKLGQVLQIRAIITNYGITLFTRKVTKIME